MRKQHRPTTVSCMERRDLAPSTTLRPASMYALSLPPCLHHQAAGVWIYHPVDTIRLGVNTGTDANVTELKLYCR